MLHYPVRPYFVLPTAAGKTAVAWMAIAEMLENKWLGIDDCPYCGSSQTTLRRFRISIRQGFDQTDFDERSNPAKQKRRDVE